MVTVKTLTLLLTLTLLNGAHAESPKKKASASNVNHSLFEAVTGESADDDRSTWDNVYKNRANAFGKEPIAFLKEHLHWTETWQSK